MASKKALTKFWNISCLHFRDMIDDICNINNDIEDIPERKSYFAIVGNALFSIVKFIGYVLHSGYRFICKNGFDILTFPFIAVFCLLLFSIVIGMFSSIPIALWLIISRATGFSKEINIVDICAVFLLSVVWTTILFSKPLKEKPAPCKR